MHLQQTHPQFIIFLPLEMNDILCLTKEEQAVFMTQFKTLEFEVGVKTNIQLFFE